jgi:hypothetical protein
MSEKAPDQQQETMAAAIDANRREILALAATWLGWDGRPIVSDGNAWTPHKAVRRTVDHLIDHIAQVDALMNGRSPRPGGWLGRSVTTPSDFAPFTESDLNEAQERLERLFDVFITQIRTTPQASWTNLRDGDFAIVDIADHMANIGYYARQVGSLGRSISD